ncbi:hypothetical protein EUGRSUZ_D01994 [Eucalyptus grandis]|uniref:Uncharacterized protein n=2 Tax=Eucalyptus grandis TaxID=71139 RepID=A0ACC3L7J1_EUCGR|nr:hypothetical protein EUGRSUZ_D01994 [Eucalyptus grandis]
MTIRGGGTIRCSNYRGEMGVEDESCLVLSGGETVDMAKLGDGFSCGRRDGFCDGDEERKSIFLFLFLTETWVDL